jgi:hypothetical protein
MHLAACSPRPQGLVARLRAAAPSRLQRVRIAKWPGNRTAPTGPAGILAFQERLQTKITTVDRKQIERPQVDSARSGPTLVQPGEIRATVRIACHDLAVEHRCFGRQFVQQLRDAAVDDDVRAHLMSLHAVAVELHLVHPAVVVCNLFRPSDVLRPPGRN